MMSERYTTDELQTQTERGDELAAQVEGLIMERDALAADNAALRAQLDAGEEWRPSTQTLPGPADEWVLMCSIEHGWDVVTGLYVHENAAAGLWWQPLSEPPQE